MQKEDMQKEIAQKEIMQKEAMQKEIMQKEIMQKEIMQKEIMQKEITQKEITQKETDPKELIHDAIQMKERLKIEQCVLMIYFVYCTILTGVTVWGKWPVWLTFVLDICYLASFLVFILQRGSYRFRAYFTAAMIQISIVMWSVCTESLSMLSPVLGTLTAVTGLYGIPEIMSMAAAAATFLNLYHILIIQSADLSSKSGIIQTALEAGSVYFVVFITYYLNRKRIENNEKQMRAIESLKEAERSKDDFLANISHEIRTPINTICGMSEIVLREDLQDSVRSDVFGIQAAGRNLLSVVSDVLDFSELQSGKMKLAEEAYNITSTVNDVINMSMARKNEKNTELIVDCMADMPCSLYGDEQKIRRVIMNLVDNALKFTQEGCVSIQISSRKTAYGINLIVCVRDTGIGMKEESMEKIFTSFNQIDTRRNRQEGGIGLGLAISQAMVDKMGGFITVHSEYGKGSEFQFVIPQKVLDDKPIVEIRDPQRLNVAVYVDMEQFESTKIRYEYGQMIEHIMSQLKVKSHFCHNLQELKRRMERENFSHIFISMAEYEEGREFFDKISSSTRIVVALDRPDDAAISNQNLFRLYKPFFILPVVMILNEEKIVQGIDENYFYQGKFTAPDVSVLAVDDNLMNIRVLEGLLRPYKIKVSMATSGAEALEKIESMKYDFVFMDHMMPEMDGIETLHRIRQKQGNYFKKIPVIALTANAIGGMREVFLEEGFQDFMAKPVELSVLERVLRRNLPQEKMICADSKRKEWDRTEKSIHTQRAVHEEVQAAWTGVSQEDVLAKQADEQPQRYTDLVKDVTLAKQADEQPRRYTDLPRELFDEQMGIKYCGGLKNYIEVLQMTRKNGPESMTRIQTCYETKDWKNYTVYVHALKSSMINIGVQKLSDMAKKMEEAGMRRDEAYIMEHHGLFMSQYEQILSKMKESRTAATDHLQINSKAAEEIQEDLLERLALEFEDAAFALDKAEMTKIAEHLASCTYHGHSLHEQMQKVLRKIEMSDYMSASEIISGLKQQFA